MELDTSMTEEETTNATAAAAWNHHHQTQYSGQPTGGSTANVHIPTPPPQQPSQYNDTDLYSAATMSSNLMMSQGTPYMAAPYSQHQHQQLLQLLAQQQLEQQQQAVQMSQQQPLRVPVPALQQTLLLSPITGVLLAVEPWTTTTATSTMFSGGPHPPPHHNYPIQFGPAPLPHHHHQQHTHAATIIHNLIPEHLRASALAPSLSGTPGHQPAVIVPHHLAAAMVTAANSLMHAAANGAPSHNLTHDAAAALLQSLVPAGNGGIPHAQHPIPVLSIPTPLPPPPMPALTVQDRSAMIPAVYNGVNLHYPGVQEIHQNPPVYIVDNFLAPTECDFLMHAANDSWTPAPVVGKGIGEISPSRTSSTCYLAREDLPDYMRKVSLLTSKPIVHCELPQVGRYLPSQQYLHHFDAFDISNEDGRRFASNGGQRVVTVLVYLNDCAQGGQTEFPAMNLQVTPRKGTALVFFPATVDGYLDKMALHAALPAIDTKYVSQVWIRQGNYYGQPSKRLPNTLGAPFDVNGKEDAILGVQSTIN